MKRQKACMRYPFHIIYNSLAKITRTITRIRSRLYYIQIIKEKDERRNVTNKL